MVSLGRDRAWWGIMGGVIWCRLMSAAIGSFEGVAGCFESIVGVFVWDLGYVWRGVVWRLLYYCISSLPFSFFFIG